RLPRAFAVLPPRGGVLHQLPRDAQEGGRVMDLTIAILTGTVIAATPLLMAALGELIVEKSGVLNLGIEGMMLLGAAVAFWAAAHGLGLPLAFAVGAFAGMAGAAVYALLALGFLANQTAAGL